MVVTMEASALEEGQGEKGQFPIKGQMKRH
jgi:hypothetical protein